MITIPVVESEESHAAALDRIQVLWGAPEGSAERAEMDALVTLVEAYEEATDPWPDLPPQEIVRSVMDSHNLTQQDLAPIFGSQGRVSEFLAGKRPLGRAQAIRLYREYNLPLDLLLGARKAA
jgi:HTH-type transcriptional regulator/antitoxin HigA